MRILKRLIIGGNLLILTQIFGQKLIKITDAETHEAIPYAKVYFDEDTYKNTDSLGNFKINEEKNPTFIAAFGYESNKFEAATSEYRLIPKFNDIAEIKVRKTKGIYRTTIGKIRREFPSFSFGSRKRIYVVATLIKHPKAPENLYISKIKFLSDVNNSQKKAKIRLVLYKNEGGRPSEIPFKSYLAECLPGKKITEVDMGENVVLMPADGIFIGFEWIIAAENLYKTKVTRHFSDGTKENVVTEELNPKILTQKAANPNLFVTKNNKWQKIDVSIRSFGNSRELALEVDLTN